MKIEKYEKNITQNKKRGVNLFSEYDSSAFNLQKKFKYVWKSKFL